MTLRVAIVDDEAHARTAIRILLAQRPDVEIVAECRHGLEALEVLRWVSVDLLLLDVQMPGLDGFGVIHALTPHRVPPRSGGHRAGSRARGRWPRAWRSGWPWLARSSGPTGSPR